MAGKDCLKTYRSKRDFRKTPEPAGQKRQKRKKTPIFVIQKHHAGRLHYDFRLEIDDVLVSWAVPKGPSTDRREKRLAVRTEDPPPDYADFEGIIPADEYGGGTVMVWDIGSYRNLREDKKDGAATMSDSLAEGMVEVWLEGKKLQGGYALIKTGKKDDNRWLLIKMNDEKADARRNPTSTQQESVLTGRTLKEIAQEEA